MLLKREELQASLDSADPLLDVGGDMLKGQMVRQKVRKAMLQRMPRG